MTFQISNPGLSNYTGNQANSIQGEILVREFQDAVGENLRFRALYSVVPICGALGNNHKFTVVGRLADADDPLSPAANTDLNSGMTVQTPASIEQYSVIMNKYGNTLDTNLLSTSLAIDNQVYRNAKDLGINAARSLEKVARRFLYAAYGGGTTYVTTADTNTTSVNVANAFGFDTVMVLGVLTQVSGTNKLPVLINASSVNVTNVSGGTLSKNLEWLPATLTVDANIAVIAVGDKVVAGNAPVQVRPGNVATPYLLTTSSTMTLQTIMNMEAQLEEDAMPAITESGYYHMILSPKGMTDLFSDSNFREAFRGLGEQDVFARQALGAFSNILFFKTSLSPRDTRTVNVGSLDIRNAIVVGGGGAVEGRYADINKLEQLADLNKGLIEQDYDSETGIVMKYRGAMDRSGEVIGLSWNYYGGFTQRTDSLTLRPNPQYTGTATAINRIYGRAVVCQHY